MNETFKKSFFCVLAPVGRPASMLSKSHMNRRGTELYASGVGRQAGVIPPPTG